MNRGQSFLCSFVVSNRYDFMADATKQFSPHLQFFFIIANLKHYPPGWKFDRNLLARHVGDDIFAGRGFREHLCTRLGMFYIYRRLHPAKAAIALHLEYVKRW